MSGRGRRAPPFTGGRCGWSRSPRLPPFAGGRCGWGKSPGLPPLTGGRFVFVLVVHSVPTISKGRVVRRGRAPHAAVRGLILWGVPWCPKGIVCDTHILQPCASQPSARCLPPWLGLLPSALVTPTLLLGLVTRSQKSQGSRSHHVEVRRGLRPRLCVVFF